MPQNHAPSDTRSKSPENVSNERNRQIFIGKCLLHVRIDHKLLLTERIRGVFSHFCALIGGAPKLTFGFGP